MRLPAAVQARRALPASQFPKRPRAGRQDSADPVFTMVSGRLVYGPCPALV